MLVKQVKLLEKWTVEVWFKAEGPLISYLETYPHFALIQRIWKPYGFPPDKLLLQVIATRDEYANLRKYLKSIPGVTYSDASPDEFNIHVLACKDCEAPYVRICRTCLATMCAAHAIQDDNGNIVCTECAQVFSPAI